MALIYAGIDEAGYGPLLGPLCVAMSVFEVTSWEEGASAPDLWKLMGRGVCRKANDRQRRIAIDDSKSLKLSNALVTKHPLVHLERGVGAFVRCIEEAIEAQSDLDLFKCLGVSVPGEEWYRGERLDALDDKRDARAFPVGLTAGELAIAASVLRGVMENAGVRIRGLSCEALGERHFNQIVSAAGTKAAATETALVKHLWTIWELARVDQGRSVRVVCDRQGGRAHYGPLLSRALPGASVVETHHSDTQSRYEISGVGDDGHQRHMHVLFLVESERQHLPVALASMAAKLVREMLMARFNTFWSERARAAGVRELKPTAGYRGDGQRWLDELGDVATAQERLAMVRMA